MKIKGVLQSFCIHRFPPKHCVYHLGIALAKLTVNVLKPILLTCMFAI